MNPLRQFAAARQALEAGRSAAQERTRDVHRELKDPVDVATRRMFARAAGRRARPALMLVMSMSYYRHEYALAGGP